MAQKDSRKQDFVQSAQKFFGYLAEMLWEHQHALPALVSGLVAHETLPAIPKGVTRKQAAEMLDCSVSTVDAMVRSGKLTPVQLEGKAKRYPVDQIERILKQRE